jgi:dipeptidyl aminopeptidase/acylaminoacyl peptidase
MNVPKGRGPFPVLVLNHGHIDTSVYTNGRGLKREQDYLARRGYVVLHPDYRNHADSDDDPDSELNLRLGYTEDAINAVLAIKNSSLDFVNKEKFGMLGHSMGGGITINTLVTQPGLVQAAVLFAPVSSDYRNNFEKWTRQRTETAEKIIEAYGTPGDEPDFWKNISSVTFFDNVTAPILIHHGADDNDVPIEWSDQTTEALQSKKKTVTFYTYEGEPHEFINAWPLVMQRTVDFFDSYLKP